MRTALKAIIIVLALLLLMSCGISNYKGMHMDSPFIWIEKKEVANDNLDAKWRYTIYTYATDRFGKTRRSYWFIWSDYDFEIGVIPLKDVFEGRQLVKYYEND